MTQGERLTQFYGEMTSLAAVVGAISAAGLDPESLRPADLYARGLDCHNLGGFPLIEQIAAAVERIAAPGRGARVLDLGCGLGGPSRFLADRFGCRVTGVDLVPVRVDVARALAEMTRAGERVEYRVADATALPFAAASFAQAWMLDASIHVRDKRRLFAGIARVLQPDGLLVLHDQMGPLGPAMRPVTRRAPWHAPPLTGLIRQVEAAGFRLLAWHDTTDRVRAFFREIRGRIPATSSVPALLDAYVKTLDGSSGRTGLLIARRR